MNSIFNRMSIRNYNDRKVEEEKIEMLLKAAMAAPSAGNQQPWEFYVIKNKETLENLSKCSPFAKCLENAPIAIVPCYNKNALKFPEYAEIDMSASTENILIEAVELGLGAVWLGIAPLEDRISKVRKVINIPENLMPFAIIPCGYPAQLHSQVNRYDESRIHYED